MTGFPWRSQNFITSRFGRQNSHKIIYTRENQQANGKNNHEWICISH